MLVLSALGILCASLAIRALFQAQTRWNRPASWKRSRFFLEAGTLLILFGIIISWPHPRLLVAFMLIAILVFAAEKFVGGGMEEDSWNEAIRRSWNSGTTRGWAWLESLSKATAPQGWPNIWKPSTMSQFPELAVARMFVALERSLSARTFVQIVFPGLTIVFALAMTAYIVSTDDELGIVLRGISPYWLASSGPIVAFAWMVSLITQYLILRLCSVEIGQGLRVLVIRPLTEAAGIGTAIGALLGLLAPGAWFVLHQFHAFQFSIGTQPPVSGTSILTMSTLGLMAGLAFGMVHSLCRLGAATTNVAFSVLNVAIGSTAAYLAARMWHDDAPQQLATTLASRVQHSQYTHSDCHPNQDLFGVAPELVAYCLSLEAPSVQPETGPLMLVFGCIVVGAALIRGVLTVHKNWKHVPVA